MRVEVRQRSDRVEVRVEVTQGRGQSRGHTG